MCMDSLAGWSQDRCLHLHVLVWMLKMTLAPALGLLQARMVPAALRFPFNNFMELSVVDGYFPLVEAFTAALVQDLHWVLPCRSLFPQ